MEVKDLEGSSLVTGHGYDPATQTLRLRFKGNAHGDFANVSPERYEEFQASDSKGKWYHANLKGNQKHPYTKVTPDSAQSA